MRCELGARVSWGGCGVCELGWVRVCELGVFAPNKNQVLHLPSCGNRRSWNAEDMPVSREEEGGDTAELDGEGHPPIKVHAHRV